MLDRIPEVRLSCWTGFYKCDCHVEQDSLRSCHSVTLDRFYNSLSVVVVIMLDRIPLVWLSCWTGFCICDCHVGQDSISVIVMLDRIP